MKNLGTNIQSYLDYYEENLTMKNVFSSEDMSSADSTNRQRIEIYLTLGFIDSIPSGQFFKAKNHLNAPHYENLHPNNDQVISNLLNKFINYEKYKVAIVKEENVYFRYIDERDLVEALMFATLYFSEKYHERTLDYFNHDQKEISILKQYKCKYLKNEQLIEEAAQHILNTSTDLERIENLESDVDLFVPNFKNHNKVIESHTYKYKDLLEFFKRDGYIFKIPVYQRDYVWNKDNVSKLVKSIEKNKPLNLSTIVLHKKEINALENIYTIVDGQQRITTLFIILRSLYDSIKYRIDIAIKNENFENIKPLISLQKRLKNDYFVLHDNTVLVGKNFKRVEGDISYKAFNKVIKGEEDYSIATSNMMENYHYLKNYFNENYSSYNQMENLYYALLDNLFITISFDSVTNEMELFEILNTSAIKLNTLDLMKSYLLSLIKQDDLEKSEVILQREFHENIFQHLDSNEKKIEKFIRVYLRFSNNKLDKTHSLFVNFKNQMNIEPESLNKEQLDEKIHDIKVKLFWYLMATGERKNLPPGLKIEDFIQTLDREIYSPMIMYYIQAFVTGKMSLNEIRNCLFEFERFEIILQVCNYRGQSLSENIDRIMYKIRKENITSPIELREIMMEENLIDETINTKKRSFRTKFKDFKFTEKIAKKVLVRMANYEYNMHKIELMDHDNLYILDTPSAEHVLPKKANKWFEAKKVTRNEHLQNNELLGNYILLEQKLNSKVSNNLFEEKIKEIRKFTKVKHDYTIVNYLVDGKKVNILDMSEWTAQDIIERNNYLSEKACDIWIIEE